MTFTLGPVQGFDTGAPGSGGIFTRSLVRDLSGLNRQFLELGLLHGPGVDPLFSWSDEVRREVDAAGVAGRQRMSACPFALFEIHLPPRTSDPGADWIAELEGVEDRPHGGGAAVACRAGCTAFRHSALFTAWRLADSAPLAARVAFGLSAAAELELNDTSSTRIALLAEMPGVIRARWARHARFWAKLRGAAQAESGNSLQRAHCFGICLMDVEHGACVKASRRQSGTRGIPE